MNDPDLPDLPPDVSALLDAARGTDPAPGRHRRHVAARLALTTGLTIPAAALGTARLAAVGWLGKVGLAAVGVIAAAGVVAHLRGGSPPVAWWLKPRATVVQAPLREAQATPVARPPERLAPASLGPRLPVASATGQPAGATVEATGRRAGEPTDATLDAELALLDRAHDALTRRDVDAASAALDAHARRFPRGHLSPEREALRVQCLASAGDRAGAFAARERFHRRYPGSVLGAAVDRAVDDAP